VAVGDQGLGYGGEENQREGGPAPVQELCFLMPARILDITLLQVSCW
jgi:hypothetical protein